MNDIATNAPVTIQRITEDRGIPTSFTHESTLLKVGADFWYVLIISFLLATACSACYQIGFGKVSKKGVAWVASAICFGLGSVLAVCLMWGAELHIARIIAISIICGFGGEHVLSIVTRVGLNFLPGGKIALDAADKDWGKPEDRNK